MSDAAKVKRAIVGKSEVLIGPFSYGYEHMKVLEWGEGAGLKIGAYCSIADNLTVMLGGNHRVDWATTYPFGHLFQEELGGEGIVGHPATKGDVTIGNDVWIGANVTILSGVTVADGAVIAAEATVSKDIGPYEIWAGNPAVLVKPRFAPAVRDALLALRWWEQPPDVVRRIAPLLSRTPTLEIIAAIRKSLAHTEPA